MQSLESQFYAFGVTVLIGLVTGIFFDFYRVMKGIIRPRKFFVYLGDLMFWVVATLVVFFMLLIGNWGEFRLYVLIGALVGALLYFKLLSRFVISSVLGIYGIIKKVVNMICRVLKFTWFLLTYPLLLVKSIIVIPVGLMGTACTKILNFAARFMKRFISGPIKGRVGAVRRRVKEKIKSWFKKPVE